MTSRWRAVWVAVVLAVGSARAAVPILPLDQVKPGMKGIGKTVFEGTRIEEFDITVIGVMKSFDFQMDMILIRLDSGPVVEKKTGIIGGMSGSPIYIDGRLIGALAYGWAFQIEPIAGVTPIEQMLEHYDPQHPVAAAARERRAGGDSPLDLRGRLLPADGPVRLGGREVGEIMVAPNADEANHLQRLRPDLAVFRPVATPLYISGVGGRALRDLEEYLRPYNLLPMAAGSTAAPPDTPFELAPGAAVGVPIASGDIDFSAVGTLTYVDGEVALAFGHPFFGFGGVELPFCSAFVHTVISSVADSNKLGGLIAPIGTMSQDRATCIGATLGPAPTTIPVEYRLRELDRANERTFRVQMSRQHQIATMFTVTLMNLAMENVAGAEYDGVVESRIEISARPSEEAEPQSVVRLNSFSEQGNASFGMNPMLDLFTALTLLRENPFGEATIEGVQVDLTFSRAHKPLMIERAQSTQTKVKPGETLEVVCDLKPFGGESESRTIQVEVPGNAPLGPLGIILIGGGDGFALRPRINPAPEPTDMASLIEWLGTDGRSDAIYCELMLASAGLEFNGHKLRDLPAPMAEALLTTTAEGLNSTPDVVEQVDEFGRPVSGIGVVVVEVVGPEGEQGEGGDVSLGNLVPQRGGLEVGLGGGMPLGLSSLAGLERMPRLAAAVSAGQPAAEARNARFLERIAWAAAPVAAVQQAGLRRLRAGTPMAPDAWRRRAAPPAEEPPADEPPADEPPDITGDLDLDSPPAMPSWRELRDVERGNLGVGGPPTGAAPETGDGEPLARPVSVWTVADAEAFGAGRFDGTYLSEDGKVAMAPRRAELGRPETDRAWAVLPRADGSVLVGGWGERATLHRVAPGGEPTELLAAEDAGVTALCALDGATALAATAPSGTLWRVTGEQATQLAQLPEPYIWAMVPDGAGGVYAATGNRGRLYRVDANGTATLVFESRDRHLLALCAAPEGGVYVGAYPTGRVYRIADGVAQSVFQAEDAGVLSLAATARHLYVGTAGSGQVYRLDRDGNVAELLSGDGGNIYALAPAGDLVYAAAGSPGRILRFNGDAQRAEVYRTEEPLLLGLSADPARLICSVAVTGEVLALDLSGSERGYYLSPVHDAGVAARWGVARWGYDSTNNAVVAIETRSGNSTTPDAAWSEWSTGMVEHEGQPVTSPPARYVQFRASFFGQAGDVCALDRVSLFYRTINRAPTVTLKAPTDGALAREDLELEWEAEDPDDDKLTYRAHFAPLGSDDWQEIRPAADEDEASGEESPAADEEPAEQPAPDEEEPAETEEQPKAAGDEAVEVAETEPLEETSVTWDTTGVADGLYRLRITASDAVRNPDDPREAEVISGVVRIDNSAPAAEPAPVEEPVPPVTELVLRDAGSWLSSAEYRLDDGKWVALLPLDGIFDSPVETVRLPAIDTADGPVVFALRVRDAAGNTANLSWTFDTAGGG